MKLHVCSFIFLLIPMGNFFMRDFGCSNGADAAEYDRPAKEAHQSRSVVVAKHGIVATSQPLAAQAGLDILKAGGNAADAAIATNAMLGVVEPMSCGIGGDLFAIYWDNKTKKLYGLNASGRSPLQLTRALLREKADAKGQIPETGPLSWSVPGCVDGWEELRSRFGTMSLKELLQTSIDTAEQGFPVSDIIGSGWRGSVKSLTAWPDSARVYLKEGRAPQVGEIMTLPELGATYRAIATQGRDEFYKGRVAQEIVSFSEKNGGHFSLRDFAEHKSDWLEPVSTVYRGYTVWELPPNGQGIAVLQMLNILEGFDLKSLGPKSAEYVHLFAEAKKLAFADRAKFYADPAFNRLPTNELISKEYAAKQRMRLDLNKAAINVVSGDPKLEHGDTVYLTVIDKDHNCCSLIQSLYFGFGSQVVPGRVGFALQNRGNLFSLDDHHLNRFEPGKRPFHTIIPAMVTKDGEPWFCFGVMGGDMQPQGHVQILINLIDFGLNPQMAGDLSRIRHGGSASPTGLPEEPSGGTLFLESGFPHETRRKLEAMGHKLGTATGSFGGYQGILIDHAHGSLHGATDPRKDGAAVGY